MPADDRAWADWQFHGGRGRGRNHRPLTVDPCEPRPRHSPRHEGQKLRSIKRAPAGDAASDTLERFAQPLLLGLTGEAGGGPIHGAGERVVVRLSAPGSTSRPSTRIVGEPRNRSTTAPSASATSTRRTSASAPISRTTRVATSSAGSPCGQPANVSTSTTRFAIHRHPASGPPGLALQSSEVKAASVVAPHLLPELLSAERSDLI